MINNKLAKKVYQQLNCEDDIELSATLKDINNCGASAGFGGFIYYKDTCKFARDNMSEILEAIKNDASGMCEDPLIFIQNFNCFGTDTISTMEIASIIYDEPDAATLNDGTDTKVLNALAWYTLEQTAYCYRLDAFEAPHLTRH